MAPAPSGGADAATEINLLLLPEVLAWSTYKQTFEELLQKVKPANSRSTSRLDIAIFGNYGVATGASRTALYTRCQTILGETYTLICAVAARKQIELDFPGGVDARIFFVDFTSEIESVSKTQPLDLSGPVIDTATLAGANRNYTTIYGIDSARGNRISAAFASLWARAEHNTPQIQALSYDSTGEQGDQTPQSDSLTPIVRPHHVVAVGGTFDHLHIGHKLLLTITVFTATPSPSSLRKITVGITGDALLVNKKFATQVESWDDRQQQTASFVESILVFHPSSDLSTIRRVETIDLPADQPNNHIVRVSYGSSLVTDYTRISDPFGPTVTEEDFTAIVISAETRAGGKAVNDKRVEKGWHELEVFEVDVLDTGEKKSGKDQESFEGKISSTEIRRKLAARSGGHARI